MHQGNSRLCPPRLSFPITVNSKYLLLSLGLYRPNTEVPVLGCSLKEVRMKASFTPCSTRPPCSRSGRQSGEVSRSYTVDRKEKNHLGKRTLTYEYLQSSGVNTPRANMRTMLTRVSRNVLPVSQCRDVRCAPSSFVAH